MQSVDAAGLGIGGDHPPRVMGVLNVSRESPYDPSVFDDPGEAAAYVDRELIAEGTDIVDVGLESANKRLDVLSAEEELDRLDRAVEAIESVSGDAVFSIETRYAEVADEALARGFEMVNDICGFADPAMPEVCAAHDAAVVKMASPPDLRRPGAVDDIDWTMQRSPEWARKASYVDKLYEALKHNGFTEKTILDPAFGGWSEAKTLEDDRETLRRLREFQALDRPILVSINRKNFLHDLAGRSTAEALPVSLAATSMAVERGAHVIRTHDVAQTRDAARIGREFARERVRTPAVEELDVTTIREATRHLAVVGTDDALADEGVVRVYRLSDLGEEREALANAVAAVPGVHLAGDEPALLLGTPNRLKELKRAIPSESESLSAILSMTRHV